MIRAFVVAFLLSCLTATGFAQDQSGPATAQSPTSAIKPTAKKPAQKAKTAAKPPAESGPCQVGVIPAVGDKFVVQKVGITVFGNEYTEVPIDWGLDDIVATRVQAAATGKSVRRITYAKGAFEPYYHPQAKLFRNSRDDLTAIVRQIASNNNCERYLVVTTYAGELAGTNQTLNGIGILDGRGPFGHPTLFTNFDVMVFDGRTFEIRRNPHANLEGVLTRAFTMEKPNPLSQLDDAAFPEPAATAAQNAILRDRVRTILTERLDKSLPDYFKPE